MVGAVLHSAHQFVLVINHSQLIAGVTRQAGGPRVTRRQSISCAEVVPATAHRPKVRCKLGLSLVGSIDGGSNGKPFGDIVLEIEVNTARVVSRVAHAIEIVDDASIDYDA